MASDELFRLLAEAKSKPSRAYRAAKAGLDIPEQALQGYLSGGEAADKIRQRRNAQMTLREMLGQDIPGLEEFGDLRGEQIKTVSPLASFLRKETDPIDSALKRDYLQARIDAIKNPKPKDPNPLDDEIKREKLEQLRKGKGSEKSISDAFNLYQAASKGLISSLEKTTTGPVVGRLPAYTSSQQTADSAVAAMAPVLKQLFRVAGEGVFTDRDQALLMKMVTDRTIRPEARKDVMKNVDNIIRAKLGMSPDLDQASSGGTKVRVSNGKETLEIDPTDIPDAVRDGYKPI